MFVCVCHFSWGQEDDDFYYRIYRRYGRVSRLSVSDGRYQALSHPRVRDLDATPLFARAREHLTATRLGTLDTRADGISNLRYRTLAVERWPQWRRGVTKVVADLMFEFMPKDLNGGQTDSEEK